MKAFMRKGVRMHALGCLAVMAGCSEQPVSNTTQNIAQNASAEESVTALTADGRSFVSGSVIWDKHKKGALFCYEPRSSDYSCESIESVENVSNDRATLMNIKKWDNLQKQVFRMKTSLKGEFLCSTVDDWSIEHTSYYITLDNVAKIQPTDVSPDPENVAKWRNDLRDRWSGIMGQEFCYRYALRLGAKGQPLPSEFEEFKYANGILQPSEKPVYVNTYTRDSLERLQLRPQN